jgi:site-specific recombinase XerD
LYWLEILSESGIENSELVKILMKEASELISIFVVTLKTAKSR